MKKDLIFSPILLVIAGALFFLKFTGMPAHITISIVGAIVLISYTIITKKEWKIPALEIIMRVLYGVALITGIIVINIHGIIALDIIHKISAALFIVTIIALLTNLSISTFFI